MSSSTTTSLPDRKVRWRVAGLVALLTLGATLLAGCGPTTQATIQATTYTIPNGAVTEGFAVCPGDTRALGGGVVQSGSASGLRVMASGPLDAEGTTAGTIDGDIPKQWYAAVRNDAGATVTVKVYALCSETTDATIEATGLGGTSGAEGYAVCPSGRRALGGGMVQSGSPAGLVLRASGPLDATNTTLETNDGDVADRWWASMYNGTGTVVQYKVFAICASGVTATVEQTTFSTGVGAANEAFADCPGDRRALGGGVVQSGDPAGLRVRASGPLDATGVTLQTDDGDVASQWYASVINTSPAARTWRVFAICE